MMVVRLESKMAVKAREKPCETALATPLPRASSSLILSKIRTLASTAMPIGQDDAGDAGQGQGGLEVGQGAEQDDDVEEEGDDGVDPGDLVEDDHEGHDGDDGHEPGHEALADGVGAEGRADRPLLEVLDAGRQRAGLEDDDEVVGFLGREPAADDAALGPGDAVLDDRGRLDLLVEDDGDLLADVGAGDLLEAGAAVGVEGEGDGRAVPLVGHPADGPQVLARDRGDLVDEIEAGLAALGIALEDLGVVGDHPVIGLEQGRLVGGRAGLDELPFQDGGDLDQLLDAVGVVDAGQLDDDLVVALPLDEGLGDAQAVDAVVDRFLGLVDRLVAEEAG